MPKPRKQKFPKAVYVEWEDSCDSHGWGEFKKESDGPMLIRSVAILIHRDKDCVALSTSLDPSGKAAGTMTISASAIKKLRRIKLDA